MLMLYIKTLLDEIHEQPSRKLQLQITRKTKAKTKKLIKDNYIDCSIKKNLLKSQSSKLRL